MQGVHHSVNTVKKLCLERDITQKQLAAAIGVSQPTVSDWMNNKKDPSGTRLAKLAEYFNVSEADILGYNQTQHHQPVTLQPKLVRLEGINLAKEMEPHMPRKLHKYVVKGSYGSGKSNLINGVLNSIGQGRYTADIDATRKVLVAKLMGLSDDNLTKLSQYADLLKIQEDMERDAKNNGK